MMIIDSGLLFGPPCSRRTPVNGQLRRKSY